MTEAKTVSYFRSSAEARLLLFWGGPEPTENNAMTSLSVNLNLLGVSDLCDIAERNFIKTERNEYCLERFSKSYSEITKPQLVDLIASKLTVHDLHSTELVLIFNKAFGSIRRLNSKHASRKQFEISIKRTAIKYIALSRKQATTHLSKFSDDDWNRHIDFNGHFVVSSESVDPWVIGDLAMLFMGFNGQGRQLDGISADCNLLKQFMDQSFPNGMFQKIMESRSTQSDELIRFNIREAFEKAKFKGISHSCVVLSGHGNLE